MNIAATARHFTKDNPPPIDTVYSEAELDASPWYYSIELEPGRVTPGQNFFNVGLTRALLSRTDLSGQRCLDIGTMEGLIPVLMERRGAARVVAYDRPSAYRDRINKVKEAHNAKFEFVSGFPLAELPLRLTGETFDVVTFSGVLYHLFSPLAGLATARGLVRNGGIMIVETAALMDDPECCTHFNAGDRFTGESYFLPTPSCLDYMIRFLRMDIIDCAYVVTHRVDGYRCARIAVTCRARHCPNDADKFMAGTLHTEIDMNEHLNWARLSTDRPLVPYRAPTARTLAWQFVGFRAVRRATRLMGLTNLSNRIDRAIGERPAEYWLRENTQSINLDKICFWAKQQHVTARDATLMIHDEA